VPDDDFYREFEHTGDLGIEVEASSRAELFAHAATALGRIMVEADGIRDNDREQIEVSADSDADLMHDLLAAALNKFLIDGFIWRSATVTERDGAISATLLGERFDRKRHELLTEVKAVTYHRLAVEPVNGKWRAIVIFDI
jgi:SHS2 domain-containing protein